MLQKNKKNKGFTLTELIVVIVIIGILAAVLVPSLTSYIDRARESAAKQDAATALSEFNQSLILQELDGSIILPGSEVADWADWDFETDVVGLHYSLTADGKLEQARYVTSRYVLEYSGSEWQVVDPESGE